jgi:hypothetical protein
VINIRPRWKPPMRFIVGDHQDRPCGSMPGIDLIANNDLALHEFWPCSIHLRRLRRGGVPSGDLIIHGAQDPYKSFPIANDHRGLT